MKKLLLIAILMLALVFTIVACTGGKTPDDTTVGDTTVETPTDAPTEEPTDAPTEEPTDAPTEPETADPADPVWIIDADGLAAATNTNNATVEKNEAGYVSLTATNADPWFMVCGNIGEMPEYMVMRYRTNTTQKAEFFMGNGAGPVGGESFVFDYNANGEWNLLIFHLPTVAPYMTSNVVGYIRFDFYTNGPEDGAFLDVEYIAFFNTAEYAQAYDFELHPAYVTPDVAGQTAVSFDTFKVNGEMYFEQDGEAGAKLDAINNTVTFGIDQAVETVTLRGWVGFSQAIDSFGYYIDNPYDQVFGEFKAPTEDAVLGIAGEHASRFEINAPVADLERGEHTIGYLAKLADGTVVLLRTEVTIVFPTHYDNYNVPQDLWTVTGHCPGIVGAEGHANSGMVAAGGVESGALVHQGAVSLGEIDLSKYDKAVIMWGCDNSDVTQGHYDASANNRIMLVSADVNGTAPADDTIIAGGTYELHGWAVQAFEIDLTEVDYNGPVYLCIDTLPGTFALFASVEFIGAEIDDGTEEPEAPEGPKVIGMNDAGSTVKHISQDGFRYLDGDLNVVEEIVTPGQYSQFDGTLEYTKGGHPCVADFGWVAMNAETFQFGYIINDGEPIMNDAYTTPASDPVKAAAATTGASNCSAFYGVLAVDSLPTGEHNIKFVMQQDGGDYVIIREYTIIVSE